MQNFDVKKDRRGLYSARKRFEVVEAPPMDFLMADGEGNPNVSRDYRDVVQALYATAYAVRAVAMEELGRKHTVAPLEGLWWADDLRVFKSRDEDEWLWRLMIVQPEWVTAEIFEKAAERASKKDLAALDRVRRERFDEGRSVQVLHVGPYDEEAPTIARMHDEFMPEQGFVPRGRHHEIYLSDVRRTDPSRLRTILRQPVAAARS